MLQLMHLVLDLLQMAKRRQRRFMHSRARVEVNMLRQQSELEPARPRNFAAIRSLFFVYQPKNRRLAGAVASDQTDMLTGIDLKRGAAQNVLRAEGFVNVGKPKQHNTGSADVSSAEPCCKAHGSIQTIRPNFHQINSTFAITSSWRTGRPRSRQIKTGANSKYFLVAPAESRKFQMPTYRATLLSPVTLLSRETRLLWPWAKRSKPALPRAFQCLLRVQARP